MTDQAKPEQTAVNDLRTAADIDARLTQLGSHHVLRYGLVTMWEKHGPTSPVGYHLSNLLELLDLSTPPAFQLKQQIRGLQRAMRDLQ